MIIIIIIHKLLLFIIIIIIIIIVVVVVSGNSRNSRKSTKSEQSDGDDSKLYTSMCNVIMNLIIIIIIDQKKKNKVRYLVRSGKSGSEDKSEPAVIAANSQESQKWNFPPILDDFNLMELDIDPSVIEDMFVDNRCGNQAWLYCIVTI